MLYQADDGPSEKGLVAAAEFHGTFQVLDLGLRVIDQPVGRGWRAPEQERLVYGIDLPKRRLKASDVARDGVTVWSDPLRRQFRLPLLDQALHLGNLTSDPRIVERP